MPESESTNRRPTDINLGEVGSRVGIQYWNDMMAVLTASFSMQSAPMLGMMQDIMIGDFDRENMAEHMRALVAAWVTGFWGTVTFPSIWFSRFGRGIPTVGLVLDTNSESTNVECVYTPISTNDLTLTTTDLQSADGKNVIATKNVEVISLDQGNRVQIRLVALSKPAAGVYSGMLYAQGAYNLLPVASILVTIVDRGGEETEGPI